MASSHHYSRSTLWFCLASGLLALALMGCSPAPSERDVRQAIEKKIEEMNNLHDKNAIIKEFRMISLQPSPITEGAWLAGFEIALYFPSPIGESQNITIDQIVELNKKDQQWEVLNILSSSNTFGEASAQLTSIEPAAGSQ